MGGCHVKSVERKNIMSEEIKNEAVETEVEQVDTQQEEKTVKLSELQRRLAIEKENHQKELQALEEAKQKAIEEAVAKAKMTESELKALQRKEEEQRLQAIQSENEQLRLQIARREMQDVAIKELGAKGLPVDENILAFVVRDNEEETALAVANMANILAKQNRESAVTTPPITSGGFGNSETINGGFKEIIQSAKNQN